MMNPKVDQYLEIGCGRCKLVGTPQCKVNSWRHIMVELRKLLLECELTEEIKWSIPCYTFNDGNIVLLTAFKEYCALSFFKGSLMKDEAGLLISQTKNVQGTRQLRFTAIEEVSNNTVLLKAYIKEAIELEKSGAEIETKKVSEYEIPDELNVKLEASPALKTAWEALTPGRKKGYILYFSGARQAKTRAARVAKHEQNIFAGKGLHDRY